MAAPEIICSREAATFLTIWLLKSGAKKLDAHQLLNDVTRPDALQRRGIWIPKSQLWEGTVWYRFTDIKALADFIIERRPKAKPTKRPALADLTFTTPPDPFEDILPALLH